MKLKFGSLKTQYQETFSQTHQEKRERAQINKIKNERGELTQMQRIIRDYYEQLYANKMDTLEEMGKFLERDNLQD